MASERWRRPARVLDIQQSPTQGLWLPDGRVQGEVEIAFDPETIERMRAGYMCVKCLEPFEHSWPERCPVCGSPVREKQAEHFAREYAGEQLLGPRRSLQEEIDSLPERAAKEREKKQ